MKLFILPETPPAGNFSMRLTTREEILGRFQKPAYKWTFQVEDGDHKGKQITKITGIEARRGESLCNFLSELQGRELTPGESVDIDDFIGKLYDVTLTSRQNDSSSVVIHKVAPAVEE